MILKIVSIDHHGYNGRDFHPSEEDRGKLVTPLQLETFYMDGDGGLHPTLDDANGELDSEESLHAIKAEINEQPVLVRMWLCATEHGKMLQLVDDEVELFRS